MVDLRQLVLDPRYHDYLAILKGARNGAVYGAKIRFPHALVMAILFGRGSWETRFKEIIRMTIKHATNLAKFVSIYKTALLAQKRLRGGKEESQDSFIAGVLAGSVVFGERVPVNEQMVLYVCSRVIASFLPRAQSPDPTSTAVGALARPIPPASKYFQIFAALSWGAAVWLFNNRPHTIQSGMWSSMKYLYKDSEHWDSLRTLLWHNT